MHTAQLSSLSVSISITKYRLVHGFRVFSNTRYGAEPEVRDHSSGRGTNLREKGRDLTQSYGKSPYSHSKIVNIK